MKKISLGKVSVKWTGEWDNQYPYKRLHGVTRAGSSFVALKDNVGIDPSASPETWQLIAQKGDKGDAFTYSDFTPEQIDELQQPAVSAASVALAVSKKAEDSASLADQARQNVIDAENQVQNNEAVRQQNETSRERGFIEFSQNSTELMSRMFEANAASEKAADKANSAASEVSATNSEIILAETSRQEAERSRVTAEKAREQDESNRQNSEASRVQSENERKSAEDSRASGETSRQEAERSRVEVEQSRVAEFNTLKAESESATSSANQAADNANKAAQTATEASAGLVKFDDRLSKVEGITSELQLAKSDYGVAEWNPDELAPECEAFYGKKDFLLNWDFYLLDTTDNQGKTTTPVGKLMRNNLLRFADGRFAPTVGITEAQRAECDVELYLDSAHQQKYCDAGAFDAVSFYQDHGMSKLYNAEGSEVRVLRPWETTETKYTIGIGREDTVYLLDNVVGTSGRKWKGVFSKPIFWDGIDVSQYPLVPTAFGPCPSCTVDKKTRNFFYLYKGETNCQSSKGQNNLCTMFFDQDKTYPRVNDMQQINNMTYARSNNADVNVPYPYAEGGYHALNTYITCLEVAYGTKYLHNPLMFGSGISANDSCANEENWLQNGGVRYKMHTEDAWKYAKWTDTKEIYYDNSKRRTNFTTLINSEHPKEACMESQMAASFAVETGVPENTEFEFYGYSYRYVSVPGTSGISGLNVRLYKKMSQTFSAYDAEGNGTDWDTEIMLRMSLFGGVNLSGDIFMYAGGGYEQVGTCVDTKLTYGHPVKMYLEPDQLKWLKVSTTSVNDNGVFDFESKYPFVGECKNTGDGYALQRMSYAGYKTVKGGSLSTGECMYCWDNRGWSSVLNQRVRIAARFRGYAYYSYCSPRSLAASYAVTNSYRNYGGSAQALIGSAAPLQAE